MSGDSEFWIFISGAVIGALLAIGFLAFGVLMPEREACERENNVYHCERIYVPAEPEGEA